MSLKILATIGLLVGVIGGVGVAAHPTGSATGTISGTVTNSSNQPVEDVCAYVQNQGHSGDACTGPTGDYSIGGLTKGRYRVTFIPYASDSYLVPQVYPGHPGLDRRTGKQVVVKAGQEVSGINATLQDGGRIEVLVHDSAGNPVSDESVCPLFDRVRQMDGNCGGTDLTGRGTTGAVPTGTSKVEAIGDVVVFAGNTESFTHATRVDVGLDETTFVEILLPPA